MSTLRPKSASGNLVPAKSSKNGRPVHPKRKPFHFGDFTFSMIDIANELNSLLPHGLHFRDFHDRDGNPWLFGFATEGMDSIEIGLNLDECPACQMATQLRQIANYFGELADAAEAAASC
jgi:hypothetical protein